MSVTGHDLQRVIREADATSQARPAAPEVPRRPAPEPSLGLSVEDVRAELRAVLASLEDLPGELRSERFPAAFDVILVPRIRAIGLEVRRLVAPPEQNDAAARVRSARSAHARVEETMRRREEVTTAAERREQARALLGALPPDELAALTKGER